MSRSLADAIARAKGACQRRATQVKSATGPRRVTVWTMLEGCDELRVGGKPLTEAWVRTNRVEPGIVAERHETGAAAIASLDQPVQTFVAINRGVGEGHHVWLNVAGCEPLPQLLQQLIGLSC